MKPRHTLVSPSPRRGANAILATVLFLTLPLSAAAFQFTEDSTYTFTLIEGGRISLENVNGDVTIEAWDRDEVSIEAVKKGRSQEALDAAKIEIDATDDAIHIETRYPERRREGRHNAASVDYTLYVPRTAELDKIELVNGSLTLAGAAGDVAASLVNGEVEARGLTGNVEISTVNGELEIQLAELDEGRRVELSSVNGSVRLEVPGGAGAEVEASTVHGDIRNDFGLEVDRSGIVGKSLDGTIGGGGARILLSNVNGSVDIRQAD